MKKAVKGELGLLKAAKDLQGELLNPQPPSFDEDEGVLAMEMKLANNAKKVALMILGTAAQKYMTELQNQQEILINAADIIIDAYAMETAILRAQKLAEKGDAAGQIADLAPDPDRVMSDVAAQDGGAAGGRMQETEQQADRRGLAGSVRPEEPEDLACVDGDVEIGQGGRRRRVRGPQGPASPAVVLGQAAGLDRLHRDTG